MTTIRSADYNNSFFPHGDINVLFETANTELNKIEERFNAKGKTKYSRLPLSRTLRRPGKKFDIAGSSR